jgi:glyoxylase-like metal-dependent hydrolase (beta-lactamase superfamily II)
VITHTDEAPVIRGDVPGQVAELLPAEQQLMAALTSGNGGESLPAAPPCPVDREVGDGDVLAFGGGAHVVHGPGHTPGSIALHLPGERVLFTGDTVAESQGSVLLGPFNLDRPGAIASYRRLTAFDVDVALPGHGEPIAGADLVDAPLGPFAG